jgi:hypothetical protein
VEGKKRWVVVLSIDIFSSFIIWLSSYTY